MVELDFIKLLFKFYKASNFAELKRRGFVAGDFKVTEDELQLNITERGYRYLNDELIVSEVTDEFLNDYRELFSKKRIGIIGKQGDVNLVKKNLAAFMNEYQVGEEQILKLAEMYIETVKDPTYIMQADYCLYKQKEGAKTSKLGEFFEMLSEENRTKLYNWV